MMPKMDGFQVCEKLKSDDRTKLIPIIIVSARSGSEDILKGLQVGADEYLPKPFEHMELLARVKNMLRLRMAQKDLQELNTTLEEKVRSQVKQLESEKKLERYLSPQIVSTIMEGKTDARMINSVDTVMVNLGCSGVAARSMSWRTLIAPSQVLCT